MLIYCLPLVGGSGRRLRKCLKHYWKYVIKPRRLNGVTQRVMNVRQNPGGIHHIWRPAARGDCVHYEHARVTGKQNGKANAVIDFPRFLQDFRQIAVAKGYIVPCVVLPLVSPYAIITVNHINWLIHRVPVNNVVAYLQDWADNPENYHIVHECGNGIGTPENNNMCCMTHSHLRQGNRNSNTFHFQVHALMVVAQDKQDYDKLTEMYNRIEPGSNLF